MFSFLDMMNHYLGYFNVNVKFKNRIYTVLGLLGDVYLFYVAFRWLANKYYILGSLIMLAAIVLLYFAIMNIFFYFTKKKPPFDISPKIERFMGKTFGFDPQAEAEKKEREMTRGRSVNNIPANGFFDQKKVLPGKLTVSALQQMNIDDLVTRLQQNNLLDLDYSGLSERQIYQQLKTENKPIYATGPGALLPYFELQNQNGQLIVFAGMNQAEKREIGQITSVGLQPISEVKDRVKLYLASATLLGGPFKVMGRNQPIEHDQPYTVSVQLAYEKKQEGQREERRQRSRM